MFDVIVQVTRRLLPAAGVTTARITAADSETARKMKALKTGDECTDAACKSAGHKKLIDTRAFDLGQSLCWNCWRLYSARKVWTSG